MTYNVSRRHTRLCSLLASISKVWGKTVSKHRHLHRFMCLLLKWYMFHHLEEELSNGCSWCTFRLNIALSFWNNYTEMHHHPTPGRWHCWCHCFGPMFSDSHGNSPVGKERATRGYPGELPGDTQKMANRQGRWLPGVTLQSSSWKLKPFRI